MILKNVVSGLVCLAFGGMLWWLAGDVPSFTATDELGGQFFPRLIAAMIILASLGLIITGFLGVEIAGGQVGGKKGQADKPAAAVAQEDDEPTESAMVMGVPIGTVRLLSFVMVMLVYTIVLDIVGYIPASLVTFSAMIWIAGEKRMTRVLLGSVIITALLYTLFAIVFGMNVPEASLF